jgi:uncharacterized protein (DUF433 family)
LALALKKVEPVAQGLNSFARSTIYPYNLFMRAMEKDLLNRITVDPNVLVGKPTIRGLRISVEQILRALAAGVPAEDLLVDYPELELEDIRAAEDLLVDYPELELEDIRAALAYAAELVAEEQLSGRFTVYQRGRLRIRG